MFEFALASSFLAFFHVPNSKLNTEKTGNLESFFCKLCCAVREVCFWLVVGVSVGTFVCGLHFTVYFSDALRVCAAHRTKRKDGG